MSWQLDSDEIKNLIRDDMIVFYDIETDGLYPPYAKMHLITAQEGMNGTPRIVETFTHKAHFRKLLADPYMLKISYNGINFDDMILHRHGYPVNERNRLDMFLAMKTVAPALPSFSLKFVNWYYFGDFHEPEFQMNRKMKHLGVKDWQGISQLNSTEERVYALHDVKQTCRVFKMIWPTLQKENHWRAYREVEMPMGLPLEEICLRGGEYLDVRKIQECQQTLDKEREEWNQKALEHTGGVVTNPNSSKQVSKWLVDEDNIELEMTDKGNLSLRKSDLMDFLPSIDDTSQDTNFLARCMFEVRRINNASSYLRNYIKALEDPVYIQRVAEGGMDAAWIPKQYTVSGARTRRILSSSKYNLNFQNPSQYAKQVLRVPTGWLAWYIDSSQIENVVHIYESKDTARRKAYEDDPDWNEYVWLANQILNGPKGQELSKKELDDMTKYRSTANPNWSIYKECKTLKLAANFGMGVTKCAKIQNISEIKAQKAFDKLHEACPAMKLLQKRIAGDLRDKGFVQDAFGHIYAGPPDIAYKIVAYLIQGCGTGSLPKAQIRANYDTLHRLDIEFDDRFNRESFPKPYIVDEQRKIASWGVMTGMTHDENSGRISLGLNTEWIIEMLEKLMWNMTIRFSHKFDGIPLRAKLGVSRTCEADQIKIDLQKPEDVEKLKKLISN